MNNLFIKNYFTPVSLIFCLPSYLFNVILNVRKDYNNSNKFEILSPNLKSIGFLLILLIYGFLSIKISRNKFIGYKNIDGIIPVYAANGFGFWIFSTLLTIFISYFFPYIPKLFYDNFVSFLVTAHIFGVFFVYYLYNRDKHDYFEKDVDDKIGYNSLFRFYRGLKFHPTFGGIDVKQWTNCRFGMISWQIIIILLFFYDKTKNGINYGILSTVLLQTIYIGKFFYWETGYFNTLDITLDRAGYYICWGCLVFIPSFYTFTIYYLINIHPNSSNYFYFVVFLFGCLFTYLNYEVDRQKEEFKTNKENTNKVKYLEVTYINNYNIINSKLLLSGFWGVSRHMNYTFEILMSFCWSIVGYDTGIMPFYYLFYIIFLLVHRIYRDEKKCKDKYGEYWNKYCNIVKYRLIKYIY